MVHILHEMILGSAEIIALLFEVVALIVMIITGIKAVINLIKKEKGFSLELMHGFSNVLSLLLGAEILKTIAPQVAMDILMIGGVIIMRVSLAVLIHWEMEQEAKHAH